MRKTLLMFVATVLSLSLSARDGLGYRGFSGGMMLHSGWVSGGDINIGGLNQSMRGLPTGIGGALKVRFGEHLRVGTEGYTSALSYGDYNSSLSVGWGGLLVDWIFEGDKLSPYFGATVGGGVVKNLTLSEKPADDFVAENNISFRKYGVLVITPFIGIERPLTERMDLNLKADCIVPLASAPDFPFGVRLYIGFMFKH